MKLAKPRRPKLGGSGKIVAPLATENDSNTSRVVFGFRHIVRGFDLSGATPQQARSFIDGLRMRSSIPWAEILGLSRKNLGSEKIAAALKVEVPGAVPDDKKTDLLSFRFGGDVERFIGYRDGSVLEIVWIDHGGDTYDHGS